MIIVGIRYRNPFKGRPHEAYKRETTRYDGDTPNYPYFSINQTWGAIKLCWRGYKAAKAEGDYDRMQLYAKRIRRLEFELDLAITEFPDIGIYGDAPEDVDLMCH